MHTHRGRFGVTGCAARSLAVGVSLLVAAASAAALEGDVDHGAWDELAERHVEAGLVNYEGLAQDHATLDHYLGTLAEADVAVLPSDAARLAFWTNAYNACAARLVLDRLPLSSVRDAKGFFDRARCRVAGEEHTLREIADAGRALGDWRFLFAAACPAVGCPPMRSEAYTAEWLDAQLDDQVTVFLANPRDGLRADDSALWVSPLFKRHAEDIVGRKLTAEALLAVLEPYLQADVLERVRGRKLKVKLLRQNWLLNAMVAGRLASPGTSSPPRVAGPPARSP